MLSIRQATPEDIPLIRQLTDVIWPATYETILSGEQIEYMLEMMYSSESLKKQMEELHHQFLLCYDDDQAVGFASYSPIEQNIYKLHKIYVLPNQQGKGIGKFVVAHIIDAIRPQGEVSPKAAAVALDLNVNRTNPAKTFYERLGFSVIREEDIDIGCGYWMNDFVMRKEIAS